MSSLNRGAAVIISRTAEYALRAVVHLAAGEDESASQTVGQIAEGTRVPAGYLAKVLQSLSRSGIIVSQRDWAAVFAEQSARNLRLEVISRDP
jgi:hypothetical protein